MSFSWQRKTFQKGVCGFMIELNLCIFQKVAWQSNCISRKPIKLLLYNPTSMSVCHY